MRIRDNIDSAVRIAEVLRDGDFISIPAAAVTAVRTPTDDCARVIEHIHDDELALALTNLVRDTGGITRDDLTTHVARLYGWTRRGPDITMRMTMLIDQLLRQGTLGGDVDGLEPAD